MDELRSMILSGEFTEKDKIVENLAQCRADCARFMMEGRCNHCADCEVNKMFNRLYSQLPTYEQFCVDQIARHKTLALEQEQNNKLMQWTVQQQIISELRNSSNSGSGNSGLEFFSFVLKMIGIFFVLLFLLRYTLFTKAYGETSKSWFADVFEQTKLVVSDVNNDGDINCVDYAVTFKAVWDATKPSGYWIDCEIVRNVNKATDFNHLFIRARQSYYSAWVYIEPNAKNLNDCDMYKVWGSRYNPACNIYGETSKWLKKKR